jgi:fructose-1,6-bisphosphatase/inositol monophosphatase family enzyme
MQIHRETRFIAQKMKIKVFISYPGEDVVFARKIKHLCESWGHNVFLAADAPNELVSNSHSGWLNKMLTNIEAADVFVLCLKESSQGARIQQVEWGHVVGKGIPKKCIVVHGGGWNPAYERVFAFVRNFQCFCCDDLKQVDLFRLSISTEPPEEDRFRLLQQLVIQAGTQLLLRYSGQFIFGRPQVLDKRKNFATSVDREIQMQMLREIRKNFPNEGIIAEEKTEKRMNLKLASEFVWTVDPLDGTLNFMGGDDRYCCGVGILRNGSPFMGAIFVPSRMELYTGGVGREAKCHSLSNGAVRVIHTSSEVGDLGDCHALSHINSESPRLDKCFENDFPRELHREVRRVWMWGSGLLAGVSVAQGCHHLFVQRITYPYDLVPYLPIIESAGGIWRTIPGDSSLCWDASNRDVGIVVACNQRIMNQVAQAFPYLGL